MTREMVFTRFERFWHWSQAVMIIALMVTGFEVNGAYHLLGYEEAADIHRLIAWFLIGLWVFAIFWHIITDEWRQYIPTTEKLLAMIRYYSYGMFDDGVPHPFRKSRFAKHNPLQRVAYLSFNILISPVIWVSGLLYMFYNDWPALGWLTLTVVAGVHAAAAFAMLCFFIAHVYMATTGKTVTAYIKAMITGYEEIETRPDESIGS